MKKGYRVRNNPGFLEGSNLSRGGSLNTEFKQTIKFSDSPSEVVHSDPQKPSVLFRAVFQLIVTTIVAREV